MWDFRRKVLEPAVQQINDNAAKAGFTVRVKLVKESRAIKWVKFEMIKTTERLALDAKLQDREKQLNLFDVHLKTTTYEQAKTMAPGRYLRPRSRVEGMGQPAKRLASEER